MPSPPFAQAQVSVNGAAAVSGGIDVPSAATLQFSGVSTVGWNQQRWELYEYPEGFATPTGWTLAADGTIFSTAVQPALITLPAASSIWGPWSIRLKINEAISNNTTTIQNLTDVATICTMLSPKGQRMLAALEGTQFCTPTTLGKAWVRTLQRNFKIIEAFLGGGGGSTLPVNTPAVEKTASYPLVSTTDHLVTFTGAGPYTGTLPAGPAAGDTYKIANASSGVVTVAASGGTLGFLPAIPSSTTLQPGDSRTYTKSTSTNWVVT